MTLVQVETIHKRTSVFPHCSFLLDLNGVLYNHYGVQLYMYSTPIFNLCDNGVLKTGAARKEVENWCAGCKFRSREVISHFVIVVFDHIIGKINCENVKTFHLCPFLVWILEIFYIWLLHEERSFFRWIERSRNWKRKKGRRKRKREPRRRRDPQGSPWKLCGASRPAYAVDLAT